MGGKPPGGEPKKKTQSVANQNPSTSSRVDRHDGAARKEKKGRED